MGTTVNMRANNSPQPSPSTSFGGFAPLTTFPPWSNDGAPSCLQRLWREDLMHRRSNSQHSSKLLYRAFAPFQKVSTTPLPSPSSVWIVRRPCKPDVQPCRRPICRVHCTTPSSNHYYPCSITHTCISNQLGQVRISLDDMASFNG